MEGILEPLTAILAIFLPIALVYGLLEWQERTRRRKQATRAGHVDHGGNTLPGNTEK